MAKHVIILGAGASYTSGYPLAEELRRLLSGHEGWQTYLNRTLLSHRSPTIRQEAEELVEHAADAIKLFREGGFGTVDEFSKLAQSEFPDHVASMKKLMTAALAFLNPEMGYLKTAGDERSRTTGFVSSDYYRFVQKLFQPNLHDLRDDIAILTFNYDPYLEYLLNRAYLIRQTAAGKNADARTLDSIASGFYSRDTAKLRKGSGFCLLKLHGTIAVPNSPGNEGFLNYDHIFGKHAPRPSDFETLEMSPVAFPWEVHAPAKQFEIVLPSKSRHGRNPWSLPGQDYKTLFDSIWTRAARELALAKKISFIGISMHRFLEQGFRRLFREIRRKARRSPVAQVSVLTASPESVRPSFDQRVAENQQTRRISSTIANALNVQGRAINIGAGPSMKAYASFAEFIDREMDPSVEKSSPAAKS